MSSVHAPRTPRPSRPDPSSRLQLVLPGDASRPALHTSPRRASIRARSRARGRLRISGPLRTSRHASSLAPRPPTRSLMSRYRFTSESVTEGHPDKLCDQVSDASSTPSWRRTRRRASPASRSPRPAWSWSPARSPRRPTSTTPKIVRETVCEIGYTDSAMGFDGNTCAVLTAVERQSPDIAQGVNEGDGLHKEQGAGDQGLMFGYATDETPELMPAPIHYAHLLAKQLTAVRKKKLGGVDFLRPDGKTQITLEYENDVPVRLDAIVVVHAARRPREVQAAARGDHRPGDRQGAAQEADGQQDQDPRQPDGALRHRRPAGRLRPHRPQDHRRQLRRHGPSRRRRLQRQGPLEGRPQRLLLRALHRQEHRGRRASPAAARSRSRTPSASRSPSA